jgi:hypothetical protein
MEAIWLAVVVAAARWTSMSASITAKVELGDRRLAKQFTSVNHTMSGGMDIGQALDSCDSRSVARHPTDEVFQCRRNMVERSCKFLPGSVARLVGDNRVSADSLDLAPAQALRCVLLDPLDIGRNELEFWSRAPRVVRGCS